MLGQDGIDFIEAWVSGEQGGRFRLQIPPLEAGNILIVDPEGELPLVQKRGVEQRMPHLVEGQFREAGVGLIE